MSEVMTLEQLRESILGHLQDDDQATLRTLRHWHASIDAHVAKAGDDELVCCGGADCGCKGATQGQYRASLAHPRPTGDGMVSVVAEDANNYCRILTALGMEEEGDPVAEVEQLIAAAYDQGTADAGVTATTAPTGEQAGEVVDEPFGGKKLPRVRIDHDGRKFELAIVLHRGHHFVTDVYQLVPQRQGPAHRRVWPKYVVSDRVNSLLDMLGVEKKGRISNYAELKCAPGVEKRS